MRRARSTSPSEAIASHQGGDPSFEVRGICFPLMWLTLACVKL
jgi:hypothetical protein